MYKGKYYLIYNSSIIYLLHEQFNEYNKIQLSNMIFNILFI